MFILCLCTTRSTSIHDEPFVQKADNGKKTELTNDGNSNNNQNCGDGHFRDRRGFLSI